ncbi:MAG: hypothetical protein ACOYIS_03805 [Candidatus Cloacimonadaceae bacterium]
MIDKQFVRPLLILLFAILIIVLVFPLIPEWDNDVFPIKRMDVIGQILGKDSLVVADSVALEVAQKRSTAKELQPLESFWEKLDEHQKGRRGQLRIAYFGDSIIEGDLVSGTLRKELQALYGGQGVGLVGITSIVNRFRKTIVHSFSPNWQSISFMTKSSVPLGILGHTYIPQSYQVKERTITPEEAPTDDSLATADTTVVAEPQKVKERVPYGGPAWVEYSGTSFAGGATTFSHIRLFYSKAPEQTEVTVIYDGETRAQYTLIPSDELQVLNLSPTSPIRKIRLEFPAHKPVHVYGLSFDQPSGIYVDNISIRGFSGMYFSRIPSKLLDAFARHLNYDLVILQYGENVSNPKTTSYDFYRRGMIKSVEHIKASMPEVPVLIISAHDRSVKTASGYQTSPDIPILVHAQSQVAEETGSAFWNLFSEMGGLNSMSNWVNASPALASKDYTHFNLRGATKVGEMLLKVINNQPEELR